MGDGSQQEQREHYDAALRNTAEPSTAEAVPKGQLAAEANVVPGSRLVSASLVFMGYHLVICYIAMENHHSINR